MICDGQHQPWPGSWTVHATVSLCPCLYYVVHVVHTWCVQLYKLEDANDEATKLQQNIFHKYIRLPCVQTQKAQMSCNVSWDILFFTTSLSPPGLHQYLHSLGLEASAAATVRGAGAGTTVREVPLGRLVGAQGLLTVSVLL